MEIKDMSIEEIETRSLEIEQLLTDDSADVDALSEEVNALEERKAFLLAEVEERKKKIEEVMDAPTIEPQEREEVRKKMDLKELRNSEQYINAYANYVKTGKDVECRKLISELAPSANVGETDGVVPVPAYVEDRIQTAWDKSDILRRIPKLFGIKGTYKVGFELSTTGAQLHLEGGEAVTEEQLLLGIAELQFLTVKKWIRVTDEVLNYKSRAFLDYIYDEIEYQIIKKAEDLVVSGITGAPQADTATEIGVPEVEIDANNETDIFALANAELSDEARNSAIIMNKRTYAYFKTLRNSLGARYDDIFDGMEVVFNNSLPVYSGSSSASGTYAIVIDFNGMRAVFPNEREEVEFKFDDKTEMEYDIVRILGKMHIGLGLVAPGRAIKVVVPGNGD